MSPQNKLFREVRGGATRVNSASVKNAIESFLHSRGVGRRSSGLAPLGPWIIAAFSSGPLFFLADSPNWVLICWAIALGFLLLIGGIGFIFFMLKHPDMLRSERFNIQKMALERGLFGDNIQGAIEDLSGLKILNEMRKKK